MKTILKVLLLLAVFVNTLLNAQAENMGEPPSVYVDCHCDKNYIKEHIPVVNYVVNSQDADVHILFTDQRTGSGGSEYSLLFIGNKQFANLNDTIKYTTNQVDSEDDRRIKMVDALKAGLVRYVYRSKASGQMKINFENSNSVSPKINNSDSWDNWVFRTSLSTAFSGQQTQNVKNFGGSISANRITEQSKINIYASTQYNESNYDYDDSRFTSISRSQNISTSFIKSIDENWSWGIWVSANKSTYSNMDLGLTASPGIEYNFFPYSESNQRQLRLEYLINSRHNQYEKETIYLKTKESLWSHKIELALELIEPWGNIGLSINEQNYLHDFDLFSVGLRGNVSWKLVRGLSLDMRCSFSKIANQITLPRGDASLEELLLQRKEIATNYTYSFNIGLSFTFGSIYNNFINPRFDD